MPLRFGDCLLDPATRELWREGRKLALAPQHFQLLALLLDHRPRPVRHEELRDALWPGTYVAHTALARVVSELRGALGDSPERAGVIRTVARFGYAFVAPVVVDLAPGRPGACALVADVHEFALPEGETLVGRAAECGVRLASLQVSRVHAKVLVRAGRATLEDQGSKNGTWVNGLRLQRPCALEEGDEVLFGLYRVVFRRASLQDPTCSPPA